MATFKENPEFRRAIQISVTEFVYVYADLAREIIRTPRFWEDWETSEPFRDIVDTGALDASMQIEYVSRMRFAVKWVTYYVQFVYFGYTLADGRRIPPRPWAELVIYENDLLELFAEITRKHLFIT